MSSRPLQPGDPAYLGVHRVLGRLGDGAQGVVFLAEAPDGTRVAIKLLHRDLVGNADARNRFLREIAAAKRVARFSTAQLLDADTAGERPYIVSEYVPGPSLHHLVMTEGPRDGANLERLAIGTATALAGIHRAGVVHRDFKPHNVLIGPDGPRVIDFGVARALDPSATMTSSAVGTPAYMAPEQFGGEAVGPAADVFAWGVTMVFAATGRPAFGNDTIPAVMHRILHVRPDLTPLPRPLVEIVAACLAKHPAERPSAQQVLLALLGEEHRAESLPPAGPLPSAGPFPSAGASSETQAGPRFGGVADGETLAGPPFGEPAAGGTPGPPSSGRKALAVAAAVVVIACVAGAAVLLTRGDKKATAARDTPSSSAAAHPTPQRTSAPASHPAAVRTPHRPAGGRSCVAARPLYQGRLSGQYCDLWGRGIPVYARPDGTSPIVGRLAHGGRANWFVGQADGGRYQQDTYWNTHWAYTLADGRPGAWGWVPIVFFRGGGNGEPDLTLAPCGDRCHPY